MRHGAITIFILTGALMPLMLGCSGQGIACTEEARICPDGSAVGRNPENNCEFDPCPEGESLLTVELPVDLSGPQWALKAQVCREAGYDIDTYGGYVVSLKETYIDEYYETEPLSLWEMYYKGEIICAYKSVRKESLLMPGIFSENDPRITQRSSE